MQTLWQDLRYGARMLLKQPGFSLICIAALAVSIGANTAIFSAANALLLRPLPVEDIDRVVVPVTLREGFDPFGSPFLEYAAYRDRAHVLGLFMGEGMKLTLLGVVIGLIAAWGATRLLVSLLFGLGATDAATFCAISVLLGLVGLIACYFPARRALSVDPVIALRAE